MAGITGLGIDDSWFNVAGQDVWRDKDSDDEDWEKVKGAPIEREAAEGTHPSLAHAYGKLVHSEDSEQNAALVQEMDRRWESAQKTAVELQIDRSSLKQEYYFRFCEQHPYIIPGMSMILLGRRFPEFILDFPFQPRKEVSPADVISKWCQFLDHWKLFPGSEQCAAAKKYACDMLPSPSSSITSEELQCTGFFLEKLTATLSQEKISPEKMKEVVLRLTNGYASKRKMSLYAELVYEYFCLADPAYLQRQFFELFKPLPKERKNSPAALIFEAHAFLQDICCFSEQRSALVDDHLKARQLVSYNAGLFYDEKQHRYTIQAAAQLLLDFGFLQPAKPVEKKEEKRV